MLILRQWSACRCFCTAVFVSLALVVSSCGSMAETTFTVGETYNIRLLACDTYEQASDIYMTHRNGGYAAGLGRVKFHMKQRNSFGEPVCGPVTGAFTIVAAPVLSGTLDFGVQGARAAAVILIRDDVSNRSFYGFFTDAVFTGGDKGI